MKPHRFLDGGKTETSTLLFAHDVERAQKSLLEGFIEESEDRQVQMIKKKRNEFLAYIIKDMAEDLKMEQKISLEFMN